MSETLSFSRRRDFKTCHRYFYHAYEQRLEPRVQKPGRRRGTAFGSAIFAVRAAHEALPVDGTTNEPPEVDVAGVVDSSVEDSYDELYLHIRDQSEWRAIELEAAKVKVMAERYIATYGIDQRREVLFDLPLVNPLTGRAMRAFRLTGKIDGLIFYRDPKSVDLIEDKFVSQITPLAIQRLPLDEQITEYVDALATKGWPATRVRYRHTRYPSINPEKAKTYKTKPDVQAESVADFVHRLKSDIDERPEFYLDEQVLFLDQELIQQHRLERWSTAQDILAKRRSYRATGQMGVWDKNTSKCLEFGGCQFLSLCEQGQTALDQYVVRPVNTEPKEEHATDAQE